jgi:hypothetical protein
MDEYLRLLILKREKRGRIIRTKEILNMGTDFQTRMYGKHVCDLCVEL